MSLIIFILLGILVGWLAHLLIGSDDGLVGDLVVGVAGSFLAGTVIEFLNTGTLNLNTSLTGFNFVSILTSTIGAIALIGIVRAFKSRK